MTSKLTITDERVISVIERLGHYASNLKWTDVRGAQDLLAAADGLRELQERRKAAMDSEPVAVPDHLTYLKEPIIRNVLADDDNSPMAHAARILAREVKFWRSTPLYRHAQPSPVVPVVPEELGRLRSTVADPKRLPRRKEWVSGQQYSYVLLEEVEAIVDEACRAAMLNGGKS
ncbi:hypothetical protein AGG97_17955 [Klebsiella michiganensis]|uniref:hypothetical protein n=1 Tax=Klebsiella michiganensis TaxID=1134687 RepID=UPI0009500381|nr:hypothetical protein [Klebsiella michiganensis]OLP14361.1 hypothetical protein AGG97_17955 [Klebsiella michiganensis]